MSTSTELEELQNKKAGLQDQSHLLQDQHKNLEEKVKVLEEKIAIEELKNSNKDAQEAISQLESKVNDLRQRLEQVTKEPKPEQPVENREQIVPPTEAQQVETTSPETLETITENEPEKEAFTVAPPEEPVLRERRLELRDRLELEDHPQIAFAAWRSQRTPSSRSSTGTRSSTEWISVAMRSADIARAGKNP